jgi:hypothetical protein
MFDCFARFDMFKNLGLDQVGIAGLLYLDQILRSRIMKSKLGTVVFEISYTSALFKTSFPEIKSVICEL